MPELNRRGALRLGAGFVSLTALGGMVVGPASSRADPNGGGDAPSLPVWDARDYGVVADGLTDDLPSINSLIKTVASAGGGTVQLPQGVVRVLGSIQMASKVTLRGHGWTSVIRLGTNLNGGGVIQFGAVSGISIEDVKIEGDRKRLTDHDMGILGQVPGGYSDVTIRRVWVDATNYAGIAILGSEDRSVVSSRVQILDCLVTDAGGQGIVAQWGIDQCRIERCTVIGYSVVHPDCIGIAAGRFAYDVFVVENRVECTQAQGSSAHGISLDSVFGRAICEKNTVLNAVGFGIEVGFVTDGSIVGNTVLGGVRAGIMLTSMGADDDRSYASNLRVAVASNVVEGTTADGIAFYMGSTTAIQDCPASARVMRQFGYLASPVDRVVDGRRLYECTTSGATGESKPARWGETILDETIADGTSVWVDRGATNAQIEISANVIRNVAGRGVFLNRVQDVVVAGNAIQQSGLSGIYIAADANMFALSENEIDGCNSFGVDGNASIMIVAFSGAPHVAKIEGNSLRGNGIADLVATDSDSGTRIDDRFLKNSSAPTVAFGSVFRTQNTVPTDVFRFLDPNSIVERTISVISDDSNTTFKNSTSGFCTLRLFGNTDFFAPSGILVKFRWENRDQQWIETFRGVDASR